MDLTAPRGSSRLEASAIPANFDHLCELVQRSWDDVLNGVQASLYHELYDFLADERSVFLLWEYDAKHLKHPEYSFSLDEGRIRSIISELLERFVHVLQRGMSIISSFDHVDNSAMAYEKANRRLVIVDSILGGALPNETFGGDPSDSNLSEDKLVRTALTRIFQGINPKLGHQKHDQEDNSDPRTELAQLSITIHRWNSQLLQLFARLPPSQIRPYNSHTLDGTKVADSDVDTLLENFPFLRQRQHVAIRLGKQVKQRREWLQSRLKQHGLMSESELLVLTSGRGERFTRIHRTRPNTQRKRGAPTREEFVSCNAHALFTDRSTCEAPGSLRQLPNLRSLRLNGVQLEYNRDIKCPFCRRMLSFENEKAWQSATSLVLPFRRADT